MERQNEGFRLSFSPSLPRSFSPSLRFALAAGWIVASIQAGVPALAEEKTSRYQLAATASDTCLWLVMGEWSAQDKTYNNWLAYFDKNSSDVHRIPGPTGPDGRVARLAAAGGSLYVFYDDGHGTHYRFAPPHDARRELRLPDEAVPDAIAGDSSSAIPQLYALVRANTADAVAREWQRTQRLRATQPAVEGIAASAPSTQPVIGASPVGGFHLVRYTGADWRPELAVPVIRPGSARVWLAVDDGRFHFFWQVTREDRQILYAWYEKRQWSDPPMTLDLPQPPAEVFVGLANKQLALMAMLPHHGRTQWQPRVYSRPARTPQTSDSQWHELPTLVSAAREPLSLPADAAAAPFGDRIAILRPAQTPELGFWSIADGAPDQTVVSGRHQIFRSIPLRRFMQSPDHGDRHDLRTGIALAALLLLVFWRRHTTFAAPASLPAGFALAGFGRRALGAMIDLLPALLIVSYVWAQDFRVALDELQLAPNDSAQMDAAAELLFIPSLTFRLIYIAWCTGSELIWSRTPGKWIAGCTVISERLTPPTWIQIVVRNATRLIELEPYPPIALPLLLLVLLTRNRQRVGDLLAHTLVVQSAATIDATIDDQN